ncbi:MAG: AbrB/MazE/SpoVT family DNA-binding domain-containing protein [Deltaproteobacteria bacterium]|nr:AbrB/MazE/SpoVT family DNA-binding domain-containing protein [Deltaproteobacteria bacterium]
MIAKVLKKGQIVIPKEIREKIGIIPGDRVEVKVVKSDILISPFREKYTEEAKGVIKGRLSLKELEELYGAR